MIIEPERLLLLTKVVTVCSLIYVSILQWRVMVWKGRYQREVNRNRRPRSVSKTRTSLPANTVEPPPVQYHRS